MLSILSIKVQPAFLESFSPPVSVLGAQSRKNDAIPQSDLTPWILALEFVLQKRYDI